MGRIAIVFVVVCALLGGGSTSESVEEEEEESGEELEFNLNGLVDVVFAIVQDQLKQQNLDELPIPDIHETFNKKVGIFMLQGSINATGGFVGSLSSIRRTGETSIDIDGKAMTLSCSLGFGLLHVRYDRYQVLIFNTGPRGKIAASVDNNSIRLGIRFELREDGCSVTLGEAKVEELGQFDVKITGLGALDWLVSKIVVAVSEKQSDHIKQQIDKALAKALTRALNKFNCDQYFTQIREQISKLGL